MFRHLIQLLLRLLLHIPNVLHCQINPLVDPAEHLSVEVGKQPFLHLRRGWQSKLKDQATFSGKINELLPCESLIQQYPQIPSREI